MLLPIGLGLAARSDLGMDGLFAARVAESGADPAGCVTLFMEESITLVLLLGLVLWTRLSPQGIPMWWQGVPSDNPGPDQREPI